MRFNYAGDNWEGQPWVAVHAIKALGRDVEAIAPAPSLQDGIVASRVHDQVNPTSDHSPDVAGRVRAIDFGGTNAQLTRWSENLRLSRDSRIRYVIFEDRMFSFCEKRGHEPYTWRPYSRTPHDKHIHVSVRPEALYSNDSSHWQLEESNMTDHTHPVVVDKTGPGETFHDDWMWGIENGIFTVYSDPTDPVEQQQLAAYLHRYHVNVVKPALRTGGVKPHAHGLTINGMTDSAG